MIFAFFYGGKVGKGGNRAKKQVRFRFRLGLGLSLIRVKVSLNPNRSFLRFRLLERFPPFSTFPPFSHILLQLKLSAAKIVLFSLQLVTRCTWLVLMSCDSKKSRHVLLRCKMGCIFCDLFFKKKETTEISNLDSLFIFSVLVFKT